MTDNLMDYGDYLDKTKIPLRLAVKTKSGWPVVLSLWYIHLEGSLYLATRGGARVVAHLLNDPACAFEIASDLPPYCGIRGQARAAVMEDRGVEILERLIDRYLGGKQNNLAEMLIRNSADEVAIRLDPVNLTSWNFSSRMADVSPAMQSLNLKSCP